MTWTISITGHDDLTEEEKVEYEKEVVDKSRALALRLKNMPGGFVISATCTTNTTGAVDLIKNHVEGE